MAETFNVDPTTIGRLRPKHLAGARPSMRVPLYKKLERRGEQIYDEMYGTSSPRGLLSEIKECFEAAIAAAEGERLAEEVQRLRARLDHIVTVHRRQFG